MSDELSRNEVNRIVDNFPPGSRRTIRACEEEMRAVMQKYGKFFGEWGFILIAVDSPYFWLFRDCLPREEGPVAHD